MRTTVLILAGFALIALMYFRRSGSPARASAMRWFLLIWLVLSAANFSYGVLGAGYSAVEELKVHAALFGLPALTAWFLLRRNTDGD